MSSLILRSAARFLMPLLILFSILTLFRGHNLPGGGFAGALIAATALALYIFAWGPLTARRTIGVEPHMLIGGGLLLALASGLLSFPFGRAFLTGLWTKLPGEPALAVGTPVFFDVGVYLVVVGSTLLIINSLTEVEEEHD